MSAPDDSPATRACSFLRARGYHRLADNHSDEAGEALTAASNMRAGLPDAPAPAAEPAAVFHPGQKADGGDAG